MKKLLFLLLVCTATIANAQDTTWSKGMAKVYGTRAEKAHQDAISHQSDNRFLCRLVGFKSFYGQNLSTYLQLSRDYALTNATTVQNTDVYILTKNKYLGKKPQSVKLYFTHDTGDRIISGKITGPFLELANLFLNFWPQDPAFSNMEQLKPNVAAVKHCYGDLISFKWNLGIPYITISKDTNIIVPVPALNASN